MWQQIRNIADERLVAFVRDFLDLQTSLSLLIAGSAGYCFQSRYISSAIDSDEAARWIAVFACLGLIVLFKDFLKRVREIHSYAKALAYMAPVIILAMIILIVIVDAATSNSAIEDKKVEDLASRIETRHIDMSQLTGWQNSRSYWQGQADYYKALEKSSGDSYKTRKDHAASQVAFYDRMIADVNNREHDQVKESDQLRKTTVVDESGSVKNAYLGTWLMLIALGLELASSRIKPYQSGIKPEVQDIANGIGGQAATLKESRTVHHEFSITIWSKDADGFKSAMTALAKEISSGNGKGLMAQTAAYFGVLRGQISRAVEQAGNNERITVPKKLLSPPSSVEVS